MKRRGLLCLTFVLAALASHTLLAQLPGGGGGGGASSTPDHEIDRLTLLTQKPVQRELNLTDKQVDQLMQRYNLMMSKADDLDDKGWEKQVKASDTWVNGTLLKGEQKKRFNEIYYQKKGPFVFAEPDAAKTLVLTNAQKKQVKDIVDKAYDEMDGGGGGGGGGDWGAEQGGGGGFAPGGAGGFNPAGGGGFAPGGGGGFDAGGFDPGGFVPGGGGGFDFGAGGFAPGGGGAAPAQKATKGGNNKAAKIQQNASNELVGLLNPTQQTKWQQMQGEPFGNKGKQPNNQPPNKGGQPAKGKGK